MGSFSSLYVFIIGTRLVIPLETCVASPNSLICHKSTPDHATVREFVISVRPLTWDGFAMRILTGQVFDCSSFFFSSSFAPLPRCSSSFWSHRNSHGAPLPSSPHPLVLFFSGFSLPLFFDEPCPCPRVEDRSDGAPN